MTTPTLHAAIQLPGPDWLQQRRSRAAEEFAQCELPSADDEMWRYTPISDLELDRYGSAAAPDPSRDDIAPLPIGYGAVVDVVDGRAVSVTVGEQARRVGIEVGPAAAVPGAEELLAGQAVDDAFDLLNQARSDPLIVRIPRGESLDGPVHVRNRHVADGVVSAPHLVVDLGAGSALTVVESHDGAGECLVVPRTDLIVGDGAHLVHTVVQRVGEQTTQIARLRAAVGSQAGVSLAAVALGGRWARLRSDCRLEGRGASAIMLGASVAHRDQIFDLRTFQDHAAPDTSSELLYKSVLDDRARAITTGLIRVEERARGTVANQTNRTIKLSPDTWAESVPNLEIENNDVKCSHASSVGPIDPDQAFYLTSRGVPPLIAERLIVTGFIDEVLSRLGVGAVRDDLRDAVVERLRGDR